MISLMCPDCPQVSYRGPAIQNAQEDQERTGSVEHSQNTAQTTGKPKTDFIPVSDFIPASGNDNLVATIEVLKKVPPERYCVES